MDGLRFASPYILGLLLGVPALAVVALRAHVSRRGVAVGTIAPAVALRRTWRVRLEPMLIALRLLAVVLLIVALARPQRGEAVAPVEGKGIDIVLALDTSLSMSEPFARNVSRLEAAQAVLTRFIAARTNDRVGLVVFRADSITLSPLTTDYAALTEDVKAAGTIRLDDGTAIGIALAKSVDVLHDSTAASRIVILLTDGQNNRFLVQPAAAARIAAKFGVRVYTVGVVTPDPANPLRADIEIDEKTLAAIADTTGGTFNRAENPGALDGIYHSIDKLEKSRFERGSVRHYDDIAPYVLAAAAAALAVEVMLRYSLFRRAA